VTEDHVAVPSVELIERGDPGSVDWHFGKSQQISCNPHWKRRSQYHRRNTTQTFDNLLSILLEHQGYVLAFNMINRVFPDLMFVLIATRATNMPCIR